MANFRISGGRAAPKNFGPPGELSLQALIKFKNISHKWKLANFHPFYRPDNYKIKIRQKM